MIANRNLLRMQHVRGSKSSDMEWKFYKNGFDALASAVLVCGLVQALLLSLKGTGDKGKFMQKAATALVTWLKSTESRCPQPPVPDGVTGSELEKYAAGLIAFANVRDAMAIQREALQYLSQAKLVAGAFEG